MREEGRKKKKGSVRKCIISQVKEADCNTFLPNRKFRLAETSKKSRVRYFSAFLGSSFSKNEM